eukprot:4026224-Amphidinium_carterae.1
MPKRLRSRQFCGRRSAVRTPAGKLGGTVGVAPGGLSSLSLASAGGGESPPVPLGVETSMSAAAPADGDRALYMVARWLSKSGD